MRTTTDLAPVEIALFTPALHRAFQTPPAVPAQVPAANVPGLLSLLTEVEDARAEEELVFADAAVARRQFAETAQVVNRYAGFLG